MRVRKRVELCTQSVLHTYVVAIQTKCERKKKYATHTHVHTQVPREKLKRDQIVEAITQKMPKLIIFCFEEKKLRSKGI